MSRYRIVRYASGFEVEFLSEDRSEMISDGTIIHYRVPFLGIALAEAYLKISSETSEKQLIEALEYEI